MGFILFVRWWYGTGWINSFLAITQRVQIIVQEFSMPILIKTLFEPWKQITLYAGPNSSVDVKIHVLFDNIFSRVFGFFIRTVVLFVGSVASGIVFIFGCFLAIFWPVVPFLPLVFIVMAVAT